MSLLEIEPDVRDAPITEPPNKWRNKYVSLATGLSHDRRSGLFFYHIKGAPYWGALIHPSKDVAESHALRDMDDPNCFPARYIGAFPVDDE